MLSSLPYGIKCFVFEDLHPTLEAMKVSEHPDFPEANKDDTAMIIYTSGTTMFLRKGVMISFDNILANAESVTKDVKIYTQNNGCWCFSLHHVYPDGYDHYSVVCWRNLCIFALHEI